LYELLCGELPYDVRGKAVAAIARVIVDEPARPLSQRDASLRGDLEAICDRALQKEPERRYPSAAALAEDVRRHLDGARVSVRVPGKLEQLRRFVRRRPAIAALIVLGFAAAILVTVLWLDARAAWQTAEREQAELEVRTNQLVIDQARSALTSDPTRSIALLRTLTPRGVDARVAWTVLDEAIGRGVATEVHREHTGEVRWIEPAPGGYVSGGYDGRALRWIGGKSQVLANEPRRVHVVRPSPDGKQYAIGFDHGGARIVDEAARVVAEVPDLEGDVERLAWSPDGTRLAAADDRGRVVVWSRSEHALVATAKQGIESLQWSPTGATLVIGSDAGEVIRIDLDANRTQAFDIGGEVQALWIDGDELAAIGRDGTLHRWRGSEVVATTATQLASKTAAFSGDGTRAMIGGVDGRIAFVDGSTVTMLPAHARQIRSVIASTDGKRFATASDDGAIRVWDFARSRVLGLRGHTQRVRQLAFTAGATELLSGDSAGSVRRWELDRIPATVFEPTAELTRIAIAADGRSLLTVDIEGEIRRWDLATGADTRVGTHGRVTAAAIGATAITASADGVVMWWKPTPVRLNVSGTVRSLAVARDDRYIAAALATGPIVLLSDGPPITLAGHAGGTDAIALSPDGTLLASGGQDRVVRVWHPASPTEPPIELGAIDGDTRHVVFARKGALLASAGDDGKVRTWIVRNGIVDPASQKIVTEHKGAVIALATDGADRLVSIGRDRTRVEIDLARDTSTRSLDADATQPIEGSAWTLRGVPLPLVGGRNLVVATDGHALVIHDTAAHDFTALRARLAAP
jgi:WD40 repeat protein